jgi:hypothetical protein
VTRRLVDDVIVVLQWDADLQIAVPFQERVIRLGNQDRYLPFGFCVDAVEQGQRRFDTDHYLGAGRFDERVVNPDDVKKGRGHVR